MFPNQNDRTDRAPPFRFFRPFLTSPEPPAATSSAFSASTFSAFSATTSSSFSALTSSAFSASTSNPFSASTSSVSYNAFRGGAVGSSAPVPAIPRNDHSQYEPLRELQALVDRAGFEFKLFLHVNTNRPNPFLVPQHNSIQPPINPSPHARPAATLNLCTSPVNNARSAGNDLPPEACGHCAAPSSAGRAAVGADVAAAPAAVGAGDAEAAAVGAGDAAAAAVGAIVAAAGCACCHRGLSQEQRKMIFQVDHENEFDWEDAQNVPEYNVTKEDTDSIYEHPSFETFRQWSLNNIPVNPQQGKPMRRAGDRKGRRAKINEMTNKRRHARRRKAIDDAINVAFLTLWIKKMLTVRRQILEFMHHKQQHQ